MYNVEVEDMKYVNMIYRNWSGSYRDTTVWGVENGDLAVLVNNTLTCVLHIFLGYWYMIVCHDFHYYLSTPIYVAMTKVVVVTLIGKKVYLNQNTPGVKKGAAKS